MQLSLMYHAQDGSVDIFLEDPRRKHGVPVESDAYASWRRERHMEPVTSIARSLSIGDAAEDEGRPTGSTNGAHARSLLTAETGPSRPDAAVPGTADADASYPRSFAHIVNLIKSGEPIPGVKDIPSTVLEGHESHSTAAPRRKPWERSPQEGVQQAGVLSTGP